MNRRRGSGAAALCVLTLAAACSSTGVEIARSDQRDSTVSTDAPDGPSSPTEPTLRPTGPRDTVPVADDGSLPAIDPVAWTSCPDQDAAWDCGAITVPMDYSEVEGRQISIALARLPARDPSRRIGSLVLNPGGPGGSGLELVYNEAMYFPQQILDQFDIVGFDPRGVGQSTAAVCPDDFVIGFESFADCIDETGELLSYLGTPNVARDLEMIRKAVGDDQLTYVGFSYGTALGAVYADMFPASVRALVLDGAIDPDAGEVNTTMEFGNDYYAQQDFEGTIDVFYELCDVTAKCVAGPHTEELLDSVKASVRDLPADYFEGETSVELGRFEVDDLVYTSMYSADYWPLLAIALRDASDGDASTIAAMYSWVQFGYPANMDSAENFQFAHLAIQCADFAGRGSRSYDCSDFPDTDEPLPDIVATDTATPIVVIGTADDPATPGRYAPQLADALEDAVAIRWEGAGHTAFLSSECINDIVIGYLVDLVVPADDQSCPFVIGASTVSERADVVFADADPDVAVTVLTDVLTAEGETPQLAECIAGQLVRRGDQRLIAHQLMGVQSPDLVGWREMVRRACAGGG